MQTAMEAAFNRARRHTKAEKRSIPKSKNPAKAQAPNALQLAAIMDTARLMDVQRSSDRNRGLKDPIVMQARPIVRTAYPAGGKCTKRFTKLPSEFVEERIASIAQQHDADKVQEYMNRPEPHTGVLIEALYACLDNEPATGTRKSVLVPVMVLETEIVD